MCLLNNSTFVYKDIDWEMFREATTHELVTVEVATDRNLSNGEIDELIEKATVGRKSVTS